jgi:uncharacterized protein (DUF305 family)
MHVPFIMQKIFVRGIIYQGNFEMTQTTSFGKPVIRAALLSTGLVMLSAQAYAQVPIIQPGAPGQTSRQLDVDEASNLAATRFSAADVTFMQDMIVHHQQAVDMAALVADRTARNELIELSRRIDLSQKDEIAFMKGWLQDRDQPLPELKGDHHEGAHATMEGMASPAQMEELAASEGADFDSLFLQLMIKHHEGALSMVGALLKKPGSAYDPVLFEFTTDVTNDQKAEITRMTAMLTGFSADPRVGLSAGYLDAGTAISNMKLLASLPRPEGFYDPQNPIGLSLKRLEAEDKEKAGEKAKDKAAEKKNDVEGEAEEDAKPDRDESKSSRSPFLSFSNTDIAFAGDIAVVGNYHGFNIYDISKGDAPELMSSVVCPGGQGDVSISGNLLITSVEQTRGRIDCGLQGIAEKVSEERFRGLRIFDISDLRMPKQVGIVQTCRGSHTHSIVSGPGEDGKLIVYNSGTSSVRDAKELAGCSDKSPYEDEQTALFRIDVIEIPVDRPQDARIIDSPAVFADPESGVIAGLWQGGDHGPETQTTRATDQCHDITVFPELKIAAGACSGNGILFDISDPLKPTRIDAVKDSSFAYWHSATFNNDGTKVLFTDEWGGGARPRCQASDPLTWGADALYDIVDQKLLFRGYYKIPAPQSDKENCVAHNGSIIPVPGRDIYVQAWYQGGVSVMDFTDSANPVEIAYFDRGPIDEKDLVLGGYWSTYWFNGLIYGSAIVRGLDVLALEPSEYLTENEIKAASLTKGGELFNPQQQFQISWQADPAVAHAYVDQLQRNKALADNRIADLREALARADQSLSDGSGGAAVAGELADLSSALKQDGAGRDVLDQKRLLALSDVLQEMATRLR